MNIVITRKFANGKEADVKEFSIAEKKKLVIDSRKAEKKVPVRRWFRVVGHKLVMYSLTTLAITPQSIGESCFSFVVSSDFNFKVTGQFSMVKNEKMGDVYIINKGENIGFLIDDEEFILKIKEEK